MNETKAITAFDWADPLRLEEQLTAEERMVRDTAAAYARDKLEPRVRDAFRDEATEQWDAIDSFLAASLVPQDDVLDALLASSEAEGLPPIQVNPLQARMLWLLARTAGARSALEVGTLGGYSTTWLARGLAAGGEIVSLELDPRHASVARASLAGVAPGVTIEVRVGRADEALRTMAVDGAAPFDVVFIDADKPGYGGYLELALPLTRPGTLILADNVIRDGRVADEPPADANAAGAHAFNTALAAHPRLDAVIVPIIRAYVDGLALAIVKA